MSHSGLQDFDCPPGLASLRNRGNDDREQSQGGYYQHTTFPMADHRTSLGMINHLGYTVRTMGMIQEREYGIERGPNRHNPNGSIPSQDPQAFSSFNHHNRSISPPANKPQYHPATYHDRDTRLFTPTSPIPANNSSNLATLWWGEIEPWMDEEYAKQVCALMGWNPLTIKVPHPAPDPVTGQQPNNPGFCYLTFPTAAQAASVLSQINGGSTSVTMPNSTKPFIMDWAPVVPTSTASSFPQGSGATAIPPQQFPKEYSIFVGDLAPETSNSDLVAVFRNPVLGLRNDREPKFIRPFLSCKSAKIMLDPVTGVSRGYGFVRFTDEADQQRALIEMHGLYCLSRPMRISPATAKYKALPITTALDLPPVQFPPATIVGLDQQAHPVTIALPLPSSNLTKSVSNPIASTTSTSSFNSNGNGVSSSGSDSSIGGSNSSNSLSSGSNTSISSSGFGSVTSEEMMNLPNNVLAQIAQQYAKGETSPIKVKGGASITQQFTQDAPIKYSFGQGEGGAPRYTISEESWKHQAQARAILGNLIGPNGEQLTSTDPYNTTVFVGGLSPLISEDTLKTFFIPFGEIHYVKVPVGKHCGFVQFVRKADAERAIEKMQGFPIGGSRIRLSWGRSQYKAAQAAAQAAVQAAQAAAMQSQLSIPGANMMTQEQAIQLLQKLNMQGYVDNVPAVLSDHGGDSGTATGSYSNAMSDSSFGEGKLHHLTLGTRDDGSHIFGSYSSNGFTNRPESRLVPSSFSPFSPDPNVTVLETKQREPFPRSEILPHPSITYAPGFFPLQTQDLKDNSNINTTTKPSPTSTRPTSAIRYNTYLEGSSPFGVNRAPGRPEVTISRPPSGQTTKIHQGEHEPQDFGAMHDLNGTLASLELDRPWKPTLDSSGASNGPISLRKIAERTPSPTN